MIHKLNPNIIDKVEYEFSLSSRENKVIKDNCIYLESHNSNEKVMISYALAQNLFIKKIHDELNVYLSDFVALSKNLVKEGDTNLSKKQCYCILGRIFLLANKITFSKGVLDVPNYDFSKETFNTYQTVQSYYNINGRTEDILDITRLIIDFYHIIIAELNEKRMVTRNKICLILVVTYSIIHFTWNVILS